MRTIEGVALCHLPALATQSIMRFQNFTKMNGAVSTYKIGAKKMSDIVRHNHFMERSDGSLRGAILQADDLRQELATKGEWIQLTFAIEGLRKIKADLDTLLRECENDVARLMPEKKVYIDGLGEIERRTTITRKWESAELLDNICRLALTDRDTGEVPMDLLNRVTALLKASLPITQSLNWRVTGLKDLDIDPDEFSDKTFGRQTIQMQKKKD